MKAHVQVGLHDACVFPMVPMIVRRQNMLVRVNVRQIQK